MKNITKNYFPTFLIFCVMLSISPLVWISIKVNVSAEYTTLLTIAIYAIELPVSLVMYNYLQHGNFKLKIQDTNVSYDYTNKSNIENRYEYLIKLLEEYNSNGQQLDVECKIKVTKSTNRSAQAQMFINDIKSGKLVIK